MYKQCIVIKLPTNDKSILYQKKGKLFSYNELTAPIANENRHLYIISDDDIREGDWVFYEPDKSVIKCEEGSLHFNPELIYNKIIASTDLSLKLPKIPQYFINKFISEFNNGNYISNVMVLDKVLDNTINIRTKLSMDISDYNSLLNEAKANNLTLEGFSEWINEKLI